MNITDALVGPIDIDAALNGLFADNKKINDAASKKITAIFSVVTKKDIINPFYVDTSVFYHHLNKNPSFKKIKGNNPYAQFLSGFLQLVQGIQTSDERIRTIYLVDDATWKTNLKTAAEQFTIAEQRRKKDGEIKDLIQLYWILSQTYDYGPANDVLSSAFCLGEFDLTKNPDWGMFFDGRPSTVNGMNLDRSVYLSDKDYYLGEKLDHDGSDSSAQEIAHNDTFPSKDRAPPKDDHSFELPVEKLLRRTNCDDATSKIMEILKICNQNGMTHKKISEKFNCSESLVQKFLAGQEPAHKLVTHVNDYYKNGGVSLLALLAEEEKQKKAIETSTWHFSDLFSWVSRKSTASSRSSNERTPHNASFSSRETTPSKGDKREEFQPLLETTTKYVKPTNGLRRRNVGGEQ